jgi:hypothetical protein
MIINNKEEYEEFYPYSKDKIKEYPKEYPCICSWSTEGGGLMGEYRQVYVIYFPKNLTADEAFLKGLYPEWIEIKMW